MNGYIYIVTNIINKKQYIGQTNNFLKRKKDHFYDTKRTNIPFHNALKKYGDMNFKWVSFSCPEEDLDWTETFLIKELDTLSQNGYNLESGGHKNKHTHKTTKEKIRKKALGKIPSKETRKKMSIAHKGTHRSLETRKKMSLAQIGNHHSEETKNKISKALTGKIVSEETRKKISLAIGGENHPFFGIKRPKHSEETKNKMSKSHSGKNHPFFGTKRPEHSEKMKQYWKDKHLKK